jgi:uncharacterized protein (TIGR02391 family)
MGIRIALERTKRIVDELRLLPSVSIGPSAAPRARQLHDYVVDPDLLKVSQKLFEDGHHARAVEEAFKYLNNLVKSRSGRTDLDGSALMKTALSANSPVLRLNSGTTTSERDEQLGYMELCSGSMIGIRNPRAHEHDWEDLEQSALQLLVFADHLICRVKTAVKA